MKNRLTPFPTLLTPRLILRRPRPEDAPALALLRSDEAVNQFLDRPTTTTEAEALQFVQKINAAIDGGTAWYWIIAIPENDRLIGTICFYNIETELNQIEIGYELMPAWQGKGLMQEAVTAVLQYGFETMELQMITACLAEGNEKSIRLLERFHFVLVPEPDNPEEGLTNYRLTRGDYYPKTHV